MRSYLEVTALEESLQNKLQEWNQKVKQNDNNYIIFICVNGFEYK